MKVRIVPSEKNGWIIGRMINELKSRNHWSVGSPSSSVEINYLVNYDQPAQLMRSLKTRKPTAAFFTHPSSPSFFRIADSVDIRICMSKKYAEVISGELVHCGVPQNYSPRLTLGVNAKFRSDGRKGEATIEYLKKIPFVRIRHLNSETANDNESQFLLHMEEFYEQIDALLVTSTVEGGPMPALEALAKGKNVIGPKGVGFLDDLPVLHYDSHNLESLTSVIHNLYRQKKQLSDQIEKFSWRNFARETNIIFQRYMEKL